jgi:hypothetical protein
MPRPVLSETTFNSDNIATSILQQANLQITNENLGVSDISSDFTKASDISVNDSDIQAYKFNGFVFLTAGLYHDGDMANNDLIATIGSSVNYPATNTVLVSLGHGGDYAHFVKADSTGSLRIIHPYNVDGNTYYINFNGFYKL